MSSDLVSLAEASGILGVSVERVRQLVVSGDLPGTRFGNAWAVPRAGVVARQHSPGSGGRPLSPLHAWAEIVAGSVDLGHPGRYRRRAHIVHCEMSGADLESLAQSSEALIGGVRGAIGYGSSLSAGDGSDLYLSRRAFDYLPNLVAYVVNPLGSVRLRIVDDEAWEVIPSDAFVPRGAVALDVLDSADPRHWIAAKQLLEND